MIRKLVFILTMLSATDVFADCSMEQPGEVTVSKGFSVVNSVAEAQVQYDALYESGLRTGNRVYFDTALKSYVLKDGQKKIKVSARFIKSLARHISAALEHGYADFAFYPDMGHAHLYMPESGDTVPARIEAHMHSEDMKFLYHTAELFMLREDFLGKLTDDPWLQWRYFSRNFVAKNDGSDDLTVLFAANKAYNTVSDVDEHLSVSTVYFNASKNGCFPFQFNGRTRYFDFTLN